MRVSRHRPTCLGGGIWRHSKQVYLCWKEFGCWWESSINNFTETNVFFWKLSNIPMISLKTMCHRLCVRTATKLVKQRVRKFHHKRQIIIQDEILRLLKVEFIREVLYSNWLSNVVVVLKKMEKLRVWVDFTDLNDLCSKTSLLFSYINQIVDTTSQHGLLSFMDAFSRYNQIPMYSANYENHIYHSIRLALL